MFGITGISWEIYKTLFWVAQLPSRQAQLPSEQGVNTVEDAALVFSGPKFFMALIAGLVLAFAFQLLLTNLSVAIGISALGNNSDSNHDHDHESGSLGGTMKKIGTGLGIFTLVSVSLALLIACYLAVKLSLIKDFALGAILGLVIWGAYFSLLVWLSSTTVGSLIGSVVNSAVSGFQAILGTAAAALGAKAVNQQVVATAEAAATAVRRELGSAIDPASIRETLEDYLERVRPPEIDIKSIRQEFERLLSDSELKNLPSESLRSISRDQFVELVSTNTSLSKRDIKRIVDQLEGVWRQVVDQQAPKRDYLGEMLDYLKSAQPDQLKGELGSRLDQLIGVLRPSQQDGQNAADKAAGPVQAAFSALLGVVMSRADLSNLDLEQIFGQLQTAKDKLSNQADQVAGMIKSGEPASFSPLRADVENYLLNTYSWEMTPENLTRTFLEVIYDQEADPTIVRQQLEQLKKSDFVQILQQRGVFTQARIQEIADQLESIRKQALVTVQQSEEEQKVQHLRRRVENYLRFTPKEQLTAPSVEHDFSAWLEDADADYDTLRNRLTQFDNNYLSQQLSTRQDIDTTEAEQIASNLIAVRDRFLTQAQTEEQEARSNAEAVWLKLESYLSNTGKDELNPQGIKQDLQTFLDHPQLGARIIRARLSRFDRDTLVQLLAQRPDVTQEQANHIIDQVQETWHGFVGTPRNITEKAKEQYDKVVTNIGDYLRSTGKEELNPESIQRDITRLLENPKSGALAIRDRLSHLDRNTLIQLLSQRQDITPEQANQIIDQVQATISSIVRAPRRIAQRTQVKVHDFQTAFAEYLRNTGKQELNPEGIQRDLQLLLNDPRAGVGNLRDRLSHLDRDTIVQLLAQRPDMTQEDANRIVNQVLSVREQFQQQIQNVQNRVQGVIDGIFGKIRNYLNSLDRPELNYDGIKQDVRKLFDDPQAGFDALRDRLGHFNRDTLVAILSSREDISEADANRLIDQIERSRDSVLRRAERMQLDAQRRLEEVKHQAQRQAEETRKAAASAAWWLFGTASVSALCAAVAGALAVL